MSRSMVLVRSLLALSGSAVAVWIGLHWPSAVVEASTSAPEPVAPAAPAPAPELTSLRSAVKACAFDPERGFGGYGSCPAYGDLAARASQRAGGFDAMMRWLDSDTPSVRQAGAHALYVGFEGAAGFADCDAMGRALGALEREVAPINAAALAGVVARFAASCDAHDAALIERLDDTSPEHALGREELASRLRAEATARPALFHTLATIAYDGREPASLRLEALDACVRADRPDHDAVDALVAELAKDPSPRVAAHAAAQRDSARHAIAIAQR